MDAGILPVKRLERAKQRLAGAFSEAERAAIAEALLLDSLETCGAASFLTWWVVSDDDEVLDRAAGAGLYSVRDEGEGLNPALRLGVERVLKAGAASVTIIPADIPLARPEDLRDLLDTAETSDLVVVPSGGDGGTNGLTLRPPDLIAPSFGPGSLQSHVAAAETLGLRCTILALDGLSLDLDTPEDVAALLLAHDQHMTSPGHTVRLLKELRPA